MNTSGERRQHRTQPAEGVFAPNGEWVPTGYAIEDAVMWVARKVKRLLRRDDSDGSTEP